MWATNLVDFGTEKIIPQILEIFFLGDKLENLVKISPTNLGDFFSPTFPQILEIIPTNLGDFFSRPNSHKSWRTFPQILEIISASGATYISDVKDRSSCTA